MPAPQTTSVPYKVGYGKPPRHTQFRKGQSGNPGGRPRRAPRERMRALALREAYRTIAVKENGRTIEVPAIQAILRSQVRLAAKGNVQAQRAVLAAIEAIEHTNMEAARIAAERKPIDYNDAARRILFILRRAKEEEEEKRLKQEAAKGDAGPPAAAGGPAQSKDGPGQAVPPAAPPTQPPAPWREPPLDPRPSYARHPARKQL